MLLTPKSSQSVTCLKKIAKAMVDKNRKWLSIKNENGFFPVVVAAYRRNEDMTQYLYKLTPVEMYGKHACAI